MSNVQSLDLYRLSIVFNLNDVKQNTVKSYPNRLTLLLAFMSLLLVVLNGCQKQIQALVEFSHGETDFSVYRKFSWPDDKPMVNQPSNIVPVIASQIKYSVLQTLKSKGYHFTLNPTSADFIVSYVLSSTNEKNHELVPILEIENEKCYHPLHETFDAALLENNSDFHSVMVLSVFDVQRCVVVWQARINTSFNPYDSDTNQEEKVSTTIVELLKAFPAKTN